MSRSKVTFSEKLSLFVVKARRAFFKMNSREKLLLMLFSVVLVFLWLSNQFDRHKAVASGIDQVHRDSEFQKLMMDNEPAVRANYDALVASIKIEDTLGIEEVRSEVDALARDRRYNFKNFELGTTKTDYGTKLLFHTIPFEVKNADYNLVGDFTNELNKSLSNVSIERIIIRPQGKNSGSIDVNYILKAIEYAK